MTDDLFSNHSSLNLTRPLAFIDLETTGININNDRIVELSILKILPDGSEQSYVFKINPTIPIPMEASKIHGIYDADVANCPTFKEVAHRVSEILIDCDLAGYNSNKFDIPLLIEEFMRAEVDFDISKRNLIDVQTIFHKKEQRTLSAAYEFYCNKKHDQAHSAQADTRATYEVLKAQLNKYPDLKNNVKFISEYTTHSRNVDIMGRIVYDDSGKEIFNFGKYKGKRVEEVLKKDPNYYNWMMDGEFSLHTKKMLTAIKLRMKH